MKRIITTLTSTLLIILLVNSCASVNSVAKRITIESGEIPPDMKMESFILIGILKEKKSYDKYVKKEYATYTGNYILTTEKELTTKYNDITKYRYFMDYHEEHSSSYSNGSFHNTTGYRYYIYDRKEKKEYLRESRSSFFALEMKAYLIAIESVRKK